jgi:hypothetical protein
VLDGLWSQVSDAAIIGTLGAKAISDAVPDLVEQALRQAGAKSDNVTVLASSGKAPRGGARDRGPVDAQPAREAFASTIQASLLEQMEPKASSTTTRSSARSKRSTPPSSALRRRRAEP